MEMRTRHLSNTNLVVRYRFAAAFGFCFSLSPSTTAVLWCCHEKALSPCRCAGRVTAHAHCAAAEQILHHRLTPGWSPVSTFSLPAYAARRLLVTYHSATSILSGECYLQPFLDEIGFETPLDSEQQGDDALVPHGVRCSSHCHVLYEFQTREPSVQEPQPASPGAGHSCGQTLTVYCSVHLPATPGLTSSNVTTCSKSTTI